MSTLLSLVTAHGRGCRRPQQEGVADDAGHDRLVCLACYRGAHRRTPASTGPSVTPPAPAAVLARASVLEPASWYSGSTHRRRMLVHLSRQDG